MGVLLKGEWKCCESKNKKKPKKYHAQRPSRWYFEEQKRRSGVCDWHKLVTITDRGGWILLGRGENEFSERFFSFFSKRRRKSIDRNRWNSIDEGRNVDEIMAIISLRMTLIWAIVLDCDLLKNGENRNSERHLFWDQTVSWILVSLCRNDYIAKQNKLTKLTKKQDDQTGLLLAKQCKFLKAEL